MAEVDHKQVIADMLMALWNIKAVADMMDRVGEIHSSDFTDEIAGGVRVIRDIAVSASEKFAGIP